MKRRLYYLFPDVPHAQSLQRDLSTLAIPGMSVHTLVDEQSRFNGTGDIHTLAETDRDAVREWYLWRINLAIFFLALVTFVVMLVTSPSLYLILPALVMAASFAAGLYFTLHIPNVHQDEFNHAIHHGEVLMMVDVPTAEINKVDQHVHRLHPEALAGGVGWAA